MAAGHWRDHAGVIVVVVKGDNGGGDPGRFGDNVGGGATISTKRVVVPGLVLELAFEITIRSKFAGFIFDPKMLVDLFKLFS